MVPNQRHFPITILTQLSLFEARAEQFKTGSSEDKIDEPSALDLYGPYPKAIPIPFLSVENKGGREVVTTPSAFVIDNAKSLFDCPPDVRDINTPDEWIPRDGRLVRLTGKHPFNSEPPLSILNQYRFITPASLHYVRNHGACPRLTWEDHTILIGGPMVPFPFELGMDQIASMSFREIPVTLVCAGNRRKEQNMVRQTIGFNWGPSGVSTNVWKGVMIRDLLLQAGVSEKRMAGKHVEFIGYEDLPNKIGPGPFKEEPWGKSVKYGTSVPLARAMNPAYDILIAYEANGEKLQPDHGFPVRLIIPGYIGGRMIKWLKRINVIQHESMNHYHYHDNRILPPQVFNMEESLHGQWWYKPEFIFNELNINSVITQPNHDETLTISHDKDQFYEVAGYAYTGGGRFISRVEVSTDNGLNWNLARIDRKEKPTDYGMYWCWIWFAYDVPVADLANCQEILCRAFDDSNNVQPEQQTWNLMGMGNNHVFRVKVHNGKTKSGEQVYRFEHPTQPGHQTGGWMTKAENKPWLARVTENWKNAAEEDSLLAISPQKSGADKRAITYDEVQQHKSEDSCWVIVNGKVYDCTDYLDIHPGGVASILINAGADATEEFFAIHSSHATAMLEKYYVGDLDESSVRASDAKDAVSESRSQVVLRPSKTISFCLQEKKIIGRDCFILNLALPTKEDVLGLPTGKHVHVSATIDGELVARPYTPISSNQDTGCLELLIKTYRPNQRFPQGGKMSQYLDTLQVGDHLDIRGPFGHLDYIGNGRFLIHGKEQPGATKVNMMAGGTGITCCYQLAAEILRNEQDKTQISLILSSREEGELWMRDTLDKWAANFPHKFKVHYVLSNTSLCPPGWMYSKGLINQTICEKHLFEPSPDVYNLLCGPPAMLDQVCVPNLKSLGHAAASIFAF